MAIQRFTENDHTRLWEHLNRLAGDAEAEVAAVVEQYGPTRVSLINGWSGVSYWDPEVERVGETVYLTGLAATPSSPFTTVFQLPSWAYPRRNLRLTASSLNNRVGMVSITSVGEVSLISVLWSGTPTGYINLTGTWRAA